MGHVFILEHIQLVAKLTTKILDFKVVSITKTCFMKKNVHLKVKIMLK